MSHIIPHTRRPFQLTISQCHHRALSTSVALSAQQRIGKPQLQSARGKMPSMKTKQIDQMNTAAGQSQLREFMGDIGILSGTFIRQTGSKLPKWYREPKQRFMIQFQAIRSWVMGWVQLLMYKREFKKAMEQKYQLRRRGLIATAAELYTEFQGAMARGDTKTIERVACKGLVDSSRDLLEWRRKNVALEWTAERLRKPQILSDRALFMAKSGGMEGAGGFRQVIVKFTTMQSLERIKRAAADRNVNIEEKSIQPTKVVEYMVMQERLWNGEFDHPRWKVQSFVEEMSLENFASREERNRKRDRALQAQQEEQRAALAA